MDSNTKKLIKKFGPKVAEKLLVKTKVSNDIFLKRLTACEGCDHQDDLGRCDFCGCFTAAKAAADTYRDPKDLKIKFSYCPAERWDENLDKFFSNFYNTTNND